MIGISTPLLIILAIVGIIVLILLIGLFIPKGMDIQSTVVINKPRQQVFDYIKYVKNQDNYSVWNRMDPDMKREYRGTDGQVGFVYYWNSNKKKNVGEGEQEIKGIKEGERIDFEIRFLHPMQSVAESQMFTRDAGAGKTEVRWTFKSEMKYPMVIMKGMFSSMLKKSQQDGLNMLKDVLEK